jgi:hypothetical protein
MRIKIFCSVFLILLFDVILLYGQSAGYPCPDPDNPCPIDDWIIVLAGGGFIFAVINLYRKQKSIQANKIK